jgi:hypothetical protein
LFDVTLEDITKDNGYFTVHFSSHLAEYDPGHGLSSLGRLLDERRIRFHLKCRHEDIKSLLDDPPKGDHGPLSEHDILNLLFSIYLNITSGQYAGSISSIEGFDSQTNPGI